MSGQYLMIMQESLEKKIEVLDEILRISREQSEVLAQDPVDYEHFDRCVDEKDPLIERLNKLDSGFEKLYQNVKADLENNKSKHKDWIENTKKLIAEIMEKSTTIQAVEARNKQAVECALRKSRRAISHDKQNLNVAMNYYRSMSNSQNVPPQFMDQKK